MHTNLLLNKANYETKIQNNEVMHACAIENFLVA